MSLYLHNSLRRQKELFRPVVSLQVGLYSCGPTVYARQHLGNLRPYVFVDVLKRTLHGLGCRVRHVINITDVGHLTDDADQGDDKLERAARAQRRSAGEIAAQFTELFQRDLEKLQVQPPTLWAFASQHIAEQQGLIRGLEAAGYTYRTPDGIYFDTSKAARVGQLSGLAGAELRPQARVRGTEAKRLATDFALWKFSPAHQQRQMEWESPWGVGFPGWHTECCAMASKYLGAPIDIHTGGVDHIPVHHENELLQAEAAFGGEAWVRTWLHCEWVMFQGAKLAKSAGGAPSLDDVERLGVPALAYRLLLLGAHYRSKLHFSWDSVEASARSLSRLQHKADELLQRAASDGAKFGEADLAHLPELAEFWRALSDDLNTPQALGALHALLDNRASCPRLRLEALRLMDSALGLGLAQSRTAEALDPRVVELRDARQRAREAKDFARADALRQELVGLGYSVEDTSAGTRLRRCP